MKRRQRGSLNVFTDAVACVIISALSLHRVNEIIDLGWWNVELYLHKHCADFTNDPRHRNTLTYQTCPEHPTVKTGFKDGLLLKEIQHF